jgi:hypothetical protein
VVALNTAPISELSFMGSSMEVAVGTGIFQVDQHRFFSEAQCLNSSCFASHRPWSRFEELRRQEGAITMGTR